MAIGNWVMIVLGLASIVLGYFMIVNEKVRLWSLSFGRGRMWVRVLGESRALMVTKYVFGPVTLLLGIGMVVGGIFGGPLGN